jgi:hypothetical protein
MQPPDTDVIKAVAQLEMQLNCQYEWMMSSFDEAGQDGAPKSD